jgi:ribonucleoside-diphosphate reductase alpha chain
MKTKPGLYENFNVSVGVWSDFWKSLVTKGDHKYSLRSPRTNAHAKYIDSHQLMELIALSAWKSAEPGVIFFDNINKYNPLIKSKGGPLKATNPCGEQSLYPYESCNLGSINLSKFVKRKADGMYEFDWQKYEQSIRAATKFLDNVIDVNKYPVDEIDVNTKLTRRIGLGIMGIADLLFLLQIPYNSKEGYDFMSKLAETLSYFSMDESIVISKSRGPFPLFGETDYKNGVIPISGFYEIPKDLHSFDWDSLIEKIKNHGIRNSWTTTIAPTGTLSMIADVSNGVEPVFALVFEKRVTVGRFFYTSKIFENVLKEHGLYNDEILLKIANNYGSVRGLDEIPDWIQNIFVTAIDVHWTEHLMAQAVWQKWIGNAIAKTINMPADATVEDVKCAYLLAHEFGLKGVTIYRDGSRSEQVLHITGSEREKKFLVKPSKFLCNYIFNNIHEPYVLEQVAPIFKNYLDNNDVKHDYDSPNPNNELGTSSFETNHRNTPSNLYAGFEQENNKVLCPTCKNILIITEGCNMCIECGFSSCASG